MSELIFSFEVEKKEKENFLVLHVLDKALGPSRIIYADRFKKPSLQEKELFSLLLKEHLKMLGISALSGILETVSISKIKISPTKALEVIKALAIAKKLNYKNKSVFFNPFAKVEVFYKVKNDQGQLEVQGFVRIEEKEHTFSSLDIFFSTEPMWCLIDQMVVPVRISDKNLFHRVYPSGLYLEGKKREEFIDFYSDDEEVSIQWQNVFEGQSPVDGSAIDALPVLKLQDTHGSFANLFMDYGNLGFVCFHEGREKFRNLSLEKSWEKDLLETGFQKKIVGSSFYYCPLDQVTKTLSFLLEIGWKVLDTKGRRVCRHKESEVKILEQDGGVLVKGKVRYEDHETNLQDVVGAFNRRDRFVELSPNAVGLIDNLKIEEELTDLTLAHIDSEGLRFKKHQVGLLDGLIQKKHASVVSLTHPLIDRIKGCSSNLSIEVSPLFQGVLYAYQQAGIEWLGFLHRFGLSGLLADDMGLGKTIQVLAFLSTIDLKEPVLIVAPTSLLFNWRREWEKFLPTTAVYIHSGKERLRTKDEISGQKVILTSYSYLRIDRGLFQNNDFDCVILDEAQMIKNPDSQVAEAACCLKAKMKLAITGTPVENRWDDMWSLFHFLEPDLLETRKEFHAQMMAAQLDDRYLRRVKKKIKPFLLRRTKEEVSLDLPEKIVQTVWVEMSSLQKDFYEGLLTKGRRILKQVEAGEAASRMQVLEALLRLRQTCCHPYLVDKTLQPQPEVSAKMERILLDMEEVVNQGRKVIIFSQFTEMLALLENQIKQAGYRYAYLDGSTRNREDVVRSFQEDPSVKIFLMSLKAGGVGLNLTAADYVFIVDPWWNEAAEKQAIDRAYRLGRREVVVARRYVTAESVEEKIMKLKEQKSKMAESLTDMEGDLATFGMQDLYLLLQ